MWIKNKSHLINTNKVAEIIVQTDTYDSRVVAVLDIDLELGDSTTLIASFKKKSDADILVEEIFNALAQGKKTFDVSENLSAAGTPAFCKRSRD